MKKTKMRSKSTEVFCLFCHRSDGRNIALYRRLHHFEWCRAYYLGIPCTGTNYAKTGGHTAHDCITTLYMIGVSLADSCAHRHFYGHLSGGIRKARQQAGLLSYGLAAESLSGIPSIIFGLVWLCCFL